MIYTVQFISVIYVFILEYFGSSIASSDPFLHVSFNYDAVSHTTHWNTTENTLEKWNKRMQEKMGLIALKKSAKKKNEKNKKMVVFPSRKTQPSTMLLFRWAFFHDFLPKACLGFFLNDNVLFISDSSVDDIRLA